MTTTNDASGPVSLCSHRSYDSIRVPLDVMVLDRADHLSVGVAVLYPGGVCPLVAHALPRYLHVSLHLLSRFLARGPGEGSPLSLSSNGRSHMRALFSKSWLKTALILMGLPPALAHATETNPVYDEAAGTVIGISLDPSHGFGEGAAAALELSPHL